MTINKTIETIKSPRISVAPMMDWTTKDYRFFARLFNPNVVLYTEMVTTGAILFGDAKRHLDYNAQEHPIVLQLGGSNPQELATCTKMAEDWGYDEVNLNVGCPSDRVQNNKIGACLMAEPDLVAECIHSMQKAVNIPVTVNGGIKTFAETQAHLQHVDGVMIGREAYHNPYLLAELGQIWNLEAPDRFDIMEQMLPYIEQRLAEGAPLSIITRHILGLFQNLPGARKWRQALSGGNAKTLTDVENAIHNMQAAIIRTEEYLKEHQF